MTTTAMKNRRRTMETIELGRGTLSRRKMVLATAQATPAIATIIETMPPMPPMTKAIPAIPTITGTRMKPRMTKATPTALAITGKRTIARVTKTTLAITTIIKKKKLPRMSKTRPTIPMETLPKTTPAVPVFMGTEKRAALEEKTPTWRALNTADGETKFGWHEPHRAVRVKMLFGDDELA